MSQQNLFFGQGYQAEFARVIYQLLMSRKWVTHADVMALRMNLSSVRELPCSVSACDGYGELRKSFMYIKQAITEKVGDDCFEIEGNNRNMRYRYVGEDDNPLVEMMNAKVVSDLREYWKFCQNSAGFFPEAWLNHFFRDCKDLLAIKAKKQKGEQIISSSIDRDLKNIEYLPDLHDWIINKQVLVINYQPYGEDCQTLVFHPHYLKEFNGRWFLFGHAEGHEPELGYNIALDRIVREPRENNEKGVQYIPAPSNFYQDFFKDIIGVSHWKGIKAQDIRVRAHDVKIFNLIETKKLHKSQKTVLEFGEHEGGKYGDFVLHIEINNEFIGQILQMGSGLEVVEPQEIREVFKRRAKALAWRYK